MPLRRYKSDGSVGCKFVHLIQRGKAFLHPHHMWLTEPFHVPKVHGMRVLMAENRSDVACDNAPPRMFVHTGAGRAISEYLLDICRRGNRHKDLRVRRCLKERGRLLINLRSKHLLHVCLACIIKATGKHHAMHFINGVVIGVARMIAPPLVLLASSARVVAWLWSGDNGWQGGRRSTGGRTC